MSAKSAIRQGDVVLVPFPFADLTGNKVRPSAVLSSDLQQPEIIVAFVTSVLTNRSPRGAEVAVLQNDPEFRATGLKTDSLIRFDKLVTLERTVVKRRLGAVGPRIMQAL